MPDRKADTPYYVGLCERMRMARVHANITMEAVAHTLGCAQQRISKMERGDVRPRADMIDAYARMFEVDRSWLLTGDAGSIEITAPEGRNKFLPANTSPPGPVIQPSEKKVREKIKKTPPPPPRPVDHTKLWRPAAWRDQPDQRTIGLSPAGGSDDALSSTQRSA